MRIVIVLALCLALIPPAFAADASAEARMLQLVNRDRAANGIGPLSFDAGLAAVARAHSADMVQSGFFSHTSPSTGDPEARINRSGIGWRAYAENISYNSSVDAAQASLMKSPGHRQNLLNSTYDTIGIGIVQGSDALFVTQVFIKARNGSSRSRVQPAPVVITEPAPLPQRRAKRRFRVPGF